MVIAGEKVKNIINTDQGDLIIAVEDDGVYIFTPDGKIILKRDGVENTVIEIDFNKSETLIGRPCYYISEGDKTGVITPECRHPEAVEYFRRAMEAYNSCDFSSTPEQLKWTIACADNLLNDLKSRADQISDRASETFGEIFRS